MPEEEFSLSALIRQAQRECEVPDPAAVAKQALSLIGDEHLREALALALVPYARSVMGRDHPRAGFTAPLRGGVNSANSDRVRRIRMAYLDSSYSVAGKRKRLGDCTAEDLVIIAAGLEKQASRLRMKAEDMRFLAGALTEHDAPTVGELPEAVLSLIFS